MTSCVKSNGQGIRLAVWPSTLHPTSLSLSAVSHVVSIREGRDRNSVSSVQLHYENAHKMLCELSSAVNTSALSIIKNRRIETLLFNLCPSF